MHQTLFYIPTHWGSFPVFGAGLLLILWFMGSLTAFLFEYKKTRQLDSLKFYIPVALLIGAAIAWVLPNVAKPSGIPIQSYGFMMLLGVLSGVGLSIWRAKRRGLDADVIYSLALWMCVPGLIGARVFFCIEYWNILRADSVMQTVRNLLDFTSGGLVVYGSVFGALLGLFLFFRFTRIDGKRLRLLPLLDIVAPAMVLGLAFGRIGCFLNGCCFGGVCDAQQIPWAVTFPAGSPPFMQQLDDGKIDLSNQFLQGIILKEGFHTGANGRTVPVLEVDRVKPGSQAKLNGVKPGQYIIAVNGVSLYSPDGTRANLQLAYYQLTADARFQGTVTINRMKEPPVSWKVNTDDEIRSLPVHPTQLYSSISAFILFVLTLIFSRFTTRNGAVFAFLFTLYPISRWILEYIRIDETSFMGTGMSISQNISLLVLAAVVLFWIYIYRYGDNDPSCLAP